MNNLLCIFDRIQSTKVEDSDGSNEVIIGLPLVELKGSSFNVNTSYMRSIKDFITQSSQWGLNHAYKDSYSYVLTYYDGYKFILDTKNNLFKVIESGSDYKSYTEIIRKSDTELLAASIESLININKGE